MLNTSNSYKNYPEIVCKRTKTFGEKFFASAFCALSPILGISLFIVLGSYSLLYVCTVDLYKTIYWHTRTRKGRIQYYRKKLRTYLNRWHKDPKKGKVRFFARQTNGESKVTVITWGDEHQALDPFYEVSFGSDEVRKYVKKTMLAYRGRFLKRYSGYHTM